uniref:hypothetical protein n=1 Tax=Conidiobolus mycophagus TaxID=1368622 RepID=UPI001D110465|nr:hypothetical protein LKZ63_mgp03 [Conidiobolus mycophagus]QZZ81338.1 hypothetical protein [Conidiobolus mycophagus]
MRKKKKTKRMKTIRQFSTMFGGVLTVALIGLGAYAVSRNGGVGIDYIRDQANNNSGGGDTMRSVLENFGLNLGYIDVFSDSPSIVLISVSMVLIFIGIQMLNFIVFRLILLYYFDKIEYMLKNYPKILKIFKRIQELNKKLSFIYYVVALLIAYINFIVAMYLLYKWLEMVNMYI